MLSLRVSKEKLESSHRSFSKDKLRDETTDFCILDNNDVSMKMQLARYNLKHQTTSFVRAAQIFKLWRSNKDVLVLL